ncbi:protein IQ-DOMAIN 32-like [Hibiscus syriacus]|uniref:Protein IQ-DOMAIN 32-like n=1 Tax=Hibiscus syriacus TaxID=106335 RepID=A0A6A3C077_HIBSY|nr:protein IQ-DOMAIN 32-like [Hibiscus syriacus]
MESSGSATFPARCTKGSGSLMTTSSWDSGTIRDDKADIMLKYLLEEALCLQADGSPKEVKLYEGIDGEDAGAADDCFEFEDEYIDIDRI